MKIKPCNGNYRVNYFVGCNTNNSHIRKFGLCPGCLYKWSMETEEGKEWYQKNLLKSKNKLNTEKLKKTKEKKIELMSITKYWSTVLQPNINAIARLIDYGQPCIATGNDYGQIHGGHYIAVGSNRSLSLNLHNIHAQSAHSNKWKSGDDKNYRDGLIKVYGIEYLEFIEGFKQCPLLNLTKQDLIDCNKKALEIKRELTKDKKVIEDPAGRILERNRINCYLYLYEDRFLVF